MMLLCLLALVDLALPGATKQLSMSAGVAALRCATYVIGLNSESMLILTHLQHVIEVLSAMVLQAVSSITEALTSPKRSSSGKDWSAGLEVPFGIMRGAALIIFKASPTSNLKGSAALAQLLKAVCSFSCQLITHPSTSESNVNLSFVCLRACVKWFGFSPNVFAGLRDVVFVAAFGQALDRTKSGNGAASSAAAALCVSITLASCELSSPPAISLCSAIASAVLSSPSDPQLVQAASVPLPYPYTLTTKISHLFYQEFARARSEASMQPLGDAVTYSTLAPLFLKGISSENASLRISVMRLMVVMCEEEEKKASNVHSSSTTSALKSSSRDSVETNPAKKRKASLSSDASAIPVSTRVSDEADDAPRSSGQSVSVTALQLMRLAGALPKPGSHPTSERESRHLTLLLCSRCRRGAYECARSQQSMFSYSFNDLITMFRSQCCSSRCCFSSVSHRGSSTRI